MLALLATGVVYAGMRHVAAVDSAQPAQAQRAPAPSHDGCLAYVSSPAIYLCPNSRAYLVSDGVWEDIGPATPVRPFRVRAPQRAAATG